MHSKRNRLTNGILGLIIAVGLIVGSASNASAAVFSGEQQLTVKNDGIASLDYWLYDDRYNVSVFQSLETPLNAIGTPIGPGMGTLLRMADETDFQSLLYILDQGPS
ncbi:hypothetical protein Enr13x_48000 [Stieleria neptunia]|uniref:Uncharacterized protein n=1 Tax=Stieleria neptunia TaxID=2527979 RepID=A0A518HVQ8_9BACT|nr:hypothetical protein [Stieleria neptunia]QDV44929.1 hypothetical protein Enr13x_48000 [Stieleria neptunia]